MFDRPLINRQSRHAYLQTFSCFVVDGDPTKNPKQPARRRNRQLAKDKVDPETSPLLTSFCSGAVYGSTLASIVFYCTLQGVSLAQCVRSIRSSLLPVAESLKYVDGFDLHTLCSGVASRRLSKIQIARLGSIIPTAISKSGKSSSATFCASQTNHKPFGSSTGSSSTTPPAAAAAACHHATTQRQGVHPRDGNPNTVIGATAAIFCIYQILTSTLFCKHSELAQEADFLVKSNSIERTLVYAIDEVLDNAVSEGGFAPAPQFEHTAIDVERRAMNRALSAVRAASRFCGLNHMDALLTIQTTMEWFRKAAWPAGEVVNERTQTSLLESMKRPLYYTSSVPYSHLPSPSQPPVELMPLCQLKNTELDTEQNAIGTSIIVGRCANRTTSEVATGSCVDHVDDAQSFVSVDVPLLDE